jgi:hypothetical protein
MRAARQSRAAVRKARTAARNARANLPPPTLSTQIAIKIQQTNAFASQARRALAEIPVTLPPLVTLIADYLGLCTLKEGPLVAALATHCESRYWSGGSPVSRLIPGATDFELQLGRDGEGDQGWASDVFGYMQLSSCRLTVDELWQWIVDRPKVPKRSLFKYDDASVGRRYEDMYDQTPIGMIAGDICRQMLYKLRALAGWPVREHVLRRCFDYGRTVPCVNSWADGPTLVVYPARASGYEFKLIHDNSSIPDAAYQPPPDKAGVVIGFLTTPMFWAWLEGDTPTIPCQLETRHEFDDVTKQRYAAAGLPGLSELAPRMCRQAHGAFRVLTNAEDC